MLRQTQHHRCVPDRLLLVQLRTFLGRHPLPSEVRIFKVYLYIINQLILNLCVSLQVSRRRCVGFAQPGTTPGAHSWQAAGSSSQAGVSASLSTQFWQDAGSSSQPGGTSVASASLAAQFWQDAGTSSQPPGTSWQGPTGTSSEHGWASATHFDLSDFDFPDIIGPSQLGGAPPVHTQEQSPSTPLPDPRATRAVPPDRFTYSQDHVRAQARRTKRGRGASHGQ